MRFSEKCAVVTGGAQGMGLAIAERLAAEDARVAVLDLQSDRAHAALAAKDSKHLGLACDIADSAAVEAAIGTARQLRKPFDITELGVAVAETLTDVR